VSTHLQRDAQVAAADASAPIESESTKDSSITKQAKELPCENSSGNLADFKVGKVDVNGVLSSKWTCKKGTTYITASVKGGSSYNWSCGVETGAATVVTTAGDTKALCFCGVYGKTGNTPCKGGVSQGASGDKGAITAPIAQDGTLGKNLDGLSQGENHATQNTDGVWEKNERATTTQVPTSVPDANAGGEQDSPSASSDDTIESNKPPARADYFDKEVDDLTTGEQRKRYASNTYSNTLTDASGLPLPSEDEMRARGSAGGSSDSTQEIATKEKPSWWQKLLFPQKYEETKNTWWGRINQWSEDRLTEEVKMAEQNKNTSFYTQSFNAHTQALESGDTKVVGGSTNIFARGAAYVKGFRLAVSSLAEDAYNYCGSVCGLAAGVVDVPVSVVAGLGELGLHVAGNAWAAGEILVSGGYAAITGDKSAWQNVTDSANYLADNARHIMGAPSGVMSMLSDGQNINFNGTYQGLRAPFDTAMMFAAPSNAPVGAAAVAGGTQGVNTAGKAGAIVGRSSGSILQRTTTGIVKCAVGATSVESLSIVEKAKGAWNSAKGYAQELFGVKPARATQVQSIEQTVRRLASEQGVRLRELSASESYTMEFINAAPDEVIVAANTRRLSTNHPENPWRVAFAELTERRMPQQDLLSQAHVPKTTFSNLKPSGNAKERLRGKYRHERSDLVITCGFV
jgi:hypothetical protein